MLYNTYRVNFASSDLDIRFQAHHITKESRIIVHEKYKKKKIVEVHENRFNFRDQYELYK